MQLTSPAFAHEASIPSIYTCDGQDISPPLAWTDPPVGTTAFALIVDDPDAPRGTWVHWVMWNLPKETRNLRANVDKKGELPDGTRQGITDFRRPGYGGPCPPSGTHRYFFRLFAMDALLELGDQTNREELERALSGHVLAESVLMGTYARKGKG